MSRFDLFFVVLDQVGVIREESSEQREINRDRERYIERDRDR